MSNNYYNSSGFPVNSADGRSADMRGELLAIGSAFDKLPALVGNAGKLVVVDAASGALTVMGNGQANVAFTSWVPALTAAVPGDLNIVYLTRIGHQYRLGGIIVTHFEIRTSTWTYTTATGALILSGFPASTIGLTTAESGVLFQGFTKANYTFVAVQFTSNGTQAFFSASGSGQTMAQVNVTDFPTAGTVILIGTVVQGG